MFTETPIGGVPIVRRKNENLATPDTVQQQDYISTGGRPETRQGATATAKNQQPIEKVDHHPDGLLRVVKVWPTIQGEGPFVGSPAVFVRLAGCNLQCPACDTDYTSNWHLHPPDYLLRLVDQARTGPCKLIIITGGEPFRQNITPFVELAINDFWMAQIETNGTLPFPPGMLELWGEFCVVCSPKTGKIVPEVEANCDALKYVVEAGHVDPADGLPLSVLGNHIRVARPDTDEVDWSPRQIYIQPQDDKDEVKNRANIKAAVESCMKFGYRLCLQTHKIAGLE